MRRPTKMIAEVVELLQAGRLNEFDAEWIARLRPEAQLAAAKKCMAKNPTFEFRQNDRSKIGNHARGFQ